jgi:predicted GTPase
MTEPPDADSAPNATEQPDSLSQSHSSAWSDRLGQVWNQASEQILKHLPVEPVAQTIVKWFNVNETEVAEILASVRAQLPTTEALLIGKPQAGKSSIVRGLTGASAEIVGQGFRPHTQHTERYAYPSSDLPLLIFTDTVGLGDIKQDTQAVIQELSRDLQQETRRARVLILTVKINDFAIDTLRQIAQQLRQRYPDIPCLLAVTCLHEVYPAATIDHPDYPPPIEPVQRAFAALQQGLAGLFDRAVLKA